MPGVALNLSNRVKGAWKGGGGYAERKLMAPSGLGGDDSPEVRWKQPVEQAKMLLFGAGPQGDSWILLYRRVLI